MASCINKMSPLARLGAKELLRWWVNEPVFLSAYGKEERTVARVIKGFYA
jgi:hypothetical protein